MLMKFRQAATGPSPWLPSLLRVQQKDIALCSQTGFLGSPDAAVVRLD